MGESSLEDIIDKMSDLKLHYNHLIKIDQNYPELINNDSYREWINGICDTLNFIDQ